MTVISKEQIKLRYEAGTMGQASCVWSLTTKHGMTDKQAIDYLNTHKHDTMCTLIGCDK